MIDFSRFKSEDLKGGVRFSEMFSKDIYRVQYIDVMNDSISIPAMSVNSLNCLLCF